MNKKFLVGFLTVFSISSVGIYKYFDKPQPADKINSVQYEKQSVPAFKVGFIDFDSIEIFLPDSNQLSELRSEELRLQLELNDAMKPVIISPPKVEEKPFDDSVWQKNAQTVISEAAEIENRKKQAAEDYRKSTEKDYLQKRDDANNQFLNEILNIKLKLQNADNMRLTDEEIKKLNSRLEEIQIERNKIQKNLIEQWTKEIADYAEQSVKDDIEKLKEKAKQSMDKVKQEALQSQIAAQKRNNDAMQQVMTETQNRMEKRQQLLAQLEDVTNRREETEKNLIESIGEKATKLAVIHKLNLLLISRENFDDDQFGGKIFPSTDTLDLTEEILKEIK